MKLIFLDIDGVGNNHEWNPVSLSSTLRRENVEQLNRIIRETGAKIVLISAWRYIINGGDMTLKGFGYMLRTHHVTAQAEIIGVTSPDEICSHCCNYKHHDAPCGRCNKNTSRADQVNRWLRDNTAYSQTDTNNDFVVIDDLDIGFTATGMPFVQPDKDTGLTAADADRAIGILNAD